MPEVIAQRDHSKLTTAERLEKHVADEIELVNFHRERLQAAEQRLRSYREELAKHAGAASK